MSITQTRNATKTKIAVAAALLVVGGAIAAFGYGWVIKVKVLGVPVVNETVGEKNVNAPKVESDGDDSIWTVDGNSNSDSNENNNANANSNANTGGNTNSGSKPTSGQ